MEVICSSETSLDFQRTTLRYIPEDGTLHNHRCENLTSYVEDISDFVIFLIVTPCSLLAGFSFSEELRVEMTRPRMRIISVELDVNRSLRYRDTSVAAYKKCMRTLVRENFFQSDHLMQMEIGR
jgi:hypothetical protein